MTIALVTAASSDIVAVYAGRLATWVRRRAGKWRHHQYRVRPGTPA